MKRRILLIIIFAILFAIKLSIVFAEPGIEITEPADGSVVHPGEDFVLRIEPVDGFVATQGDVAISKFFYERFTSLPASFTVTAPQEVSGKLYISVIADATGDTGAVAEANLIVEQTATLQSLEIDQSDDISVDLDWNGNIEEGEDSGNIVIVYGIYSDGIKRKIPKEEITFTSSNPSVISIDNEGNYQVHKFGEASITVSNPGVSKIILVVFKEPTGIRPSEAIPPTTTIDIQPPTNSAGWHNQDLTITLTAQDNEGGAGMQEVDWRFAGKAKADYVNGNSATVTYDVEGVKIFSYWSRDKEGNEDDNKVEISLDKTPPVTTATVMPEPNQADWHNSDVTVSFTATDSLSGVKSVTSPVTVSTEGAEQSIAGEAIDIADNKGSASVILNIDKAAPLVTITTNPSILWSPDNKMVDVAINGDVTDNLSGIESLTFKVTDEYGKVQPTLTGFGSTIKLEASRDGSDKDGRIYTISATAKDKAGNEFTTSVAVTVPHDQRKK